MFNLILKQLLMKQEKSLSPEIYASYITTFLAYRDLYIIFFIISLKKY